MHTTTPPGSLDSDARCERCGCAVDPAAASCGACNSSLPPPNASRAPSSAGALGDQRYAPGPAPVGNYDISLGATESLSATFKLWSENLARLAVLGFLPYALMIPLAVGGMVFAFMPDAYRLLDGFDGGMDAWWPLLLAGGTAVGALMVVLTLASTAACVHLVDEKAQGSDVTVGAALLASFRHVGWLFVACIAIGVVWTLGFAPPVAALAFAIAEESWAIASLMVPALALSVVAFVVAARLLPMMPVIIVEDTDAFTAIGRAWRLTEGRTMKVVSAALLFGAAYFGVAMVVGMLGIVPILGSLIQMGVNAILVPLCYVFAFVIYAGCVREARANA